MTPMLYDCTCIIEYSIYIVQNYSCSSCTSRVRRYFILYISILRPTWFPTIALGKVVWWRTFTFYKRKMRISNLLQKEEPHGWRDKSVLSRTFYYTNWIITETWRQMTLIPSSCGRHTKTLYGKLSVSKPILISNPYRYSRNQKSWKPFSAHVMTKESMTIAIATAKLQKYPTTTN